MSEQEASRRLVKSPPELWAQCSDPAELSRHLSGFGEITITRVEPESTVAWEGESASGTVTLESSGWGTRVRLTAAREVTGPDPVAVTDPTHAPAAAVAPVTVLESEAATRRLAARLGGLLRRRPAPAALTPVAPSESPALATWPVASSPEAEPPSAAGRDLIIELEAALDSLGQAHHRPFSRS